MCSCAFLCRAEVAGRAGHRCVGVLPHHKNVGDFANISLPTTETPAETLSLLCIGKFEQSVNVSSVALVVAREPETQKEKAQSSRVC